MKVNVIIVRGGKETAYYGTLRAFVVQEGKRGENLLKGHQFSNVESAKRVIQAVLVGQNIEFEVHE